MTESDACTLEHSRLGIASSVLALVAGAAFSVGVCLAGAESAASRQSTHDRALGLSVEALVSGPILLWLVGVVLGFFAVSQGKRKRLFPILGVVLNGAALVLIGLALLGAASLEGSESDRNSTAQPQ